MSINYRLLAATRLRNAKRRARISLSTLCVLCAALNLAPESWIVPSGPAPAGAAMSSPAGTGAPLQAAKREVRPQATCP